MKKLSAVFWDVDGTIADTELCGHRVAFNLAFKDFDVDWFWNKEIYIRLLKISGGLNRIVYYRNYVKKDLSDIVCAEIQSRKRFYYKKIIESGKISPREGVLRLIKELANFDIQQTIVTTSGRDSLDPFLNTSLNNYLHLFSNIITFEDVSKHKPFPDAYELAIKLSRQPPDNCLAIEDSDIGVKAAKESNCNCLLTLPTWQASLENNSQIANACVDSLGNIDKPTNLIYGKPLTTHFVNYDYLLQIIN